jgi:isoleucyl-tRNA synthetase
MVDADREKISKSKQGQGGYQKPQTAERYIKEFGADVLRLWVASQDFRNDIIVSDERLQKVGETYRVLRNALRYQLSNLFDFDPERHRVPVEALDPLDRWILQEFARLEEDVARAYDAFEYHTVYQRVSQFAAVELSAMYHDVVKDRLYTDPAGSPRRRSTQTALHWIASGLCQMLAPILSFTADEAWEFLPGEKAASVHLAKWERLAPAGLEGETEFKDLWELRQSALPELERLRREKVIGKALDAAVTVRGDSTNAGYALIARFQRAFQELLNVSAVEMEEAADVPGGIAFQARRAKGTKCERCWHWEMDVGSDPNHPTLCGRCASAVRSFQGASA